MTTETKLVISWVCLIVGWFLGASFVAFPIGIGLAISVENDGGNAGLVKWLNIISFIIIIMSFIVLMMFSAMLY